MTRSFKVLFSSFLGISIVMSLSLAAFAATPDSKDTVAPSDVEKLTAVIGDKMVTLRWDPAKDDNGVVGYKVYVGPDEVTATNTAKYAEHKQIENVTNFEVKDLENGKMYYMAVTAVDAAGNESENYSPYVAVKPMNKIVAAVNDVESKTVAAVTKDEKVADVVAAAPSAPAAPAGNDTTAPTVKSAVATYKGQVKVTFSEGVKLPALKPDKSFTVQDNIVYEKLNVKDAFMDPNDKTGTVVLLDTDDQNPDSDYVVTVSSDVEDLAGNPISSGTSDVAQFKGSSMTLEAYLKAHPPVSAVKSEEEKKNGTLVATAEAGSGAAKDAKDDFKISKLEVQNDTTVKVTFSKPVVLSINPTENFALAKKGDAKAVLTISSIKVDESKMSVTITATMEPKASYTLTMTDVLDTKGGVLSKENSTYDFVSEVVPPKKDTTPPEDVSKFVARAAKTLTAKLSWTGSKNSAGDLIEYIIYRSLDGKKYGQVTSLSKGDTAYEVPELAPGYYYYKITAKDGSGNESKGKSVAIRLAETGPEVGLLALMSLGLGRVFGRRKK